MITRRQLVLAGSVVVAGAPGMARASIPPLTTHLSRVYENGSGREAADGFSRVGWYVEWCVSERRAAETRRLWTGDPLGGQWMEYYPSDPDDLVVPDVYDPHLTSFRQWHTLAGVAAAPGTLICAVLQRGAMVAVIRAPSAGETWAHDLLVRYADVWFAGDEPLLTDIQGLLPTTDLVGPDVEISQEPGFPL